MKKITLLLTLMITNAFSADMLNCIIHKGGEPENVIKSMDINLLTSYTEVQSYKKELDDTTVGISKLGHLPLLLKIHEDVEDGVANNYVSSTSHSLLKKMGLEDTINLSSSTSSIANGFEYFRGYEITCVFKQ